MTDYEFIVEEDPSCEEFLREVAKYDKSTELHGKLFGRSKTLAWLHHYGKMGYIDIESEKGKPLKISLTEKGQEKIKD